MDRAASIECEILAIMDLLSRRVRVATDAQLEAYCKTFPVGRPSLETALRQMLARGLVQRDRFHLRLPTVDAPLIRWNVGEPRPDFDQFAWILVKRFSQAAVARVEVFWATAKGARLTGGVGGKLRQPDQIEHDLGTTAIYLNQHQCRPDLASFWIGEDLLRRDYACLFPTKIPDAALVAEKRVLLIIESAGQYGAARLRAFHQFCARKKVPYELW